MKMKLDLSNGCLVSVEQSELDRRIASVRALLMDKEAQLFFAAYPVKSGWGKWLTGTDVQGRPSEGGVLVGCSGNVVVVGSGALIPRGSEGVHNDAMAPSVQGEGFSGYARSEGFSADLMEAMMGRAEGCRILLANPAQLRADTKEYLVANFPALELVDVSREAAALRAIKSEAELAIIRDNVRMMDKVFAGACVYINPLKLEREIVTDLRYAAYRLGCGGMDDQIVAPVELLSGVDGERADTSQPVYPGRLVKYGDRVDIRMYAQGNDGYYAGLARSYCLAEPAESTKCLWEAAVRAQDVAAQALRPGGTVGEAARAANASLKEAGLKEDSRTMIHGIGEIACESPYLFEADPIPVEENMVFYIGPTADDGVIYPVSCGDLYLVGARETVRLSAFPRQLVRLY